MVTSHPLLAPIPPRYPSSSTSKSHRYPFHAPLETFHPHEALNDAMKAAGQSFGVGLVVSALQNSLNKHNKGAMGVLTRTGGTIAMFTGAGFAYSFTRAVTANVREENGALNSAAGGAAAGMFLGLSYKSLPMALGLAAFLGTMIGAFEAGGTPFGGVIRRDQQTPEEKLAQRASFFRQKQPQAEEALA